MAVHFPGEEKNHSAVMGSVWNQGPIPRCFAFSSSKCVRGARELRGLGQEEVSPQQLVDCGARFRPKTREVEGYAWLMFKYMVDHDLADKKHYPRKICRRYAGCQWKGRCQRLPRGIEKFRIEEYHALSDLAEVYGYLDRQPLVAKVALCSEFTEFKGRGIYRGPRAGKLKNPELHEVVVLGRGQDPDTKESYEIIMNSWGTSWGYKGYARISSQVKINLEFEERLPKRKKRTWDKDFSLLWDYLAPIV